VTSPLECCQADPRPEGCPEPPRYYVEWLEGEEDYSGTVCATCTAKLRAGIRWSSDHERPEVTLACDL
jgi:hypothetical protein